MRPACYLIGLLFAAGLGRAAASEGPAVRAEAHVDRDRIALADRVTLTFTVEGPRVLQVEPIQTPTRSPLWEVVPAGGPETTPLPGERVRWRQRFHLEPLQAGRLTLALTPLRYRLGDGPWIDHPWKDLAIEVTTVVLDPAITSLRGNAQIQEVPPPPRVNWWPLLAGLVLLAIGAGGLLRYRRRRGEAPTPALPPDQWALRELDAIDRQGLPAAGEAERYHQLVSDVVRRYVELRLGLPATQQTTAEFLAAAPLADPVRERMRDFLQRCDLAKFARAAYGVEECQETARVARELIGRIGQVQASETG